MSYKVEKKKQKIGAWLITYCLFPAQINIDENLGICMDMRFHLKVLSNLRFIY